MNMENRKPAILLASMVAFVATGAMGAESENSGRDFTLKVLPLLKEKCFACHGDDPAKIKGELTLLTREAMLKGGENSHHVLVPGKGEESDLFVSMTWQNPDLEMPPKENDRLNPEQIELVKSWINAGAPWPSEDEQKQHREEERSVISNAEGMIMKHSGGLSDDWTYRRYKPEDVWAFLPVKEPQIAEGNAAPSFKNQQSLFSNRQSKAIDSLHAAKLTKSAATPAPQADPRTLIRRASFDLIGIPPTPEHFLIEGLYDY